MSVNRAAVSSSSQQQAALDRTNTVLLLGMKSDSRAMNHNTKYHRSHSHMISAFLSVKHAEFGTTLCGCFFFLCVCACVSV